MQIETGQVIDTQLLMTHPPESMKSPATVLLILLNCIDVLALRCLMVIGICMAGILINGKG
jgi:hypothetical protein